MPRDLTLERNAVGAMAAHEQCRVDIGGVHDVLGGQEPLGRQALVDPGGSRHVRLHRRAGRHVGDQVCRLLVADLGDMHLGARPPELPLQAAMHLRVLGGLQPVAGRGQLRDRAPAQPPSVALVMGLPDLPQRLNHCSGAGRRCRRRFQSVE